jgi:NAD(P)-dependent dehydrogenase (short-subunit alcohol dehydrogenase family)
VSNKKVFDAAGATALVTGANQGIGLGFVEALLARGVRRVYAGARRSETLEDLVELDPERVRPLLLDVTDAAHCEEAAALAEDVTLLVNNAGIPGSSEAGERRFLSASSMADARSVFETDFWAPVRLCRLFAPTIVANGGGAICNIISIGALFCLPEYSSYSTAKAALAAATAGMRAELDREPVLVSGVFTAGVKTRMSARNYDVKMTPLEHAHQVLDAMAAGEEDIFAGENATDIRDAIHADAKAFERQVIERFHTAPVSID